MIWGGARAKAGEKTQRLLARQQVGREKKLNANFLPQAPQIINGPSLTCLIQYFASAIVWQSYTSVSPSWNLLIHLYCLYWWFFAIRCHVPAVTL